MVGAGAAAVTVGAIFADRHRSKRDNLEDVGFMPWPLISLMGTLVTLVSFALAVKFA